MEEDDIFIQGNRVKEAIKKFRQFTLCCRKHNIELAGGKLQFGTMVDLSGMRLGGKDGYKLTLVKAEAISGPKAPENVSEVHSLLGLINGFQNFIPELTQLVLHISELLKKDVPFVWTKECEHDMEEVKKSLTGPLGLQPFKQDLCIELYINFSRLGMGLLLTQCP